MSAAAARARRFVLGRLYPILDVRDTQGDAPGRLAKTAGALAAAGCPLLQLRAKTLPAGAFEALTRRILAAVAGTGTRVLVNDRADVALAAGADGVHLGDTDLPPAEARRLLGPAAIIGYSTHSEREAAAAPTQADYLGFGPVGESPTKAGVRTPRGFDALARAVAATDRPVVAIGGMSLATAAQAFAAGAASIAVIRELELSEDPAALVAAYRRAADERVAGGEGP